MGIRALSYSMGFPIAKLMRSSAGKGEENYTLCNRNLHAPIDPGGIVFAQQY
jgi:hypothetical protein